MYHFDCHILYAHHEYLRLFRMGSKESSRKLAIKRLELEKHRLIKTDLTDAEKHLSTESHSRSYSPNHTMAAGLIDQNRPKTMNSASK